MLCFDWNFVIT